MANPLYLTLVTAIYLLSLLPTSPTGQGYLGVEEGVSYGPIADDGSCTDPDLLPCQPRDTLIKLPFPQNAGHVVKILPQVKTQSFLVGHKYIWLKLIFLSKSFSP